LDRELFGALRLLVSDVSANLPAQQFLLDELHVLIRLVAQLSAKTGFPAYCLSTAVYKILRTEAGYILPLLI